MLSVHQQSAQLLRIEPRRIAWAVAQFRQDAIAQVAVQATGGDVLE